MMTKKVRGERGHPCATPTETVYSWLSLPLAYTLRFGEIAHKLSLGTSISEPSIKYRTKQLIKLIGKIPPEIIKALTRPVEAITPGELICWQAYDPNWSLDDNGWRYGQTLDINGTQAIQELYVDTSGVPTPVGDPHLPHHDSFPASWSDTHRLSVWGNPISKGTKSKGTKSKSTNSKGSKETLSARKPIFIRDRMDMTSVPDEHWIFLNEKQGIRLSAFSISRITKAKQLRNTDKPRCEKK